MKILVFDTETTGLPVKGASIYEKNKWPYIIQISYILYDLSTNETFIKDNYVKINPTVEITPGSFEAHKITREMLNEKGIHIVEAMNNFNALLYSCDLVIGHNLSFDKRMVFVECLRHQLDQKFTIFNQDKKICKPEYCTMKNTTEFCNLIRLSQSNKTYLKSPSLTELYQKLFPEETLPANLHNSIVDVLITLRCYMKYQHNIDIVKTNTEIKEMFSQLQTIN